jgi:hypothetical protein
MREAMPQSVDRFVLLDAQDWMTDGQLNALWRAISRQPRPTWVIFRVLRAILPGRVDSEFCTSGNISKRARAAGRDRSSILAAFISMNTVEPARPWRSHGPDVTGSGGFMMQPAYLLGGTSCDKLPPGGSMEIGCGMS